MGTILYIYIYKYQQIKRTHTLHTYIYICKYIYTYVYIYVCVCVHEILISHGIMRSNDSSSDEPPAQDCRTPPRSPRAPRQQGDVSASMSYIN